MVNGICPVCQSRRVYAKHNVLRTQSGLYQIELKLVGGEFFGRKSIDVVTYLCARCGHMSLTVVNTALDGLEEHLVEWGWSAIPARDFDGAA